MSRRTPSIWQRLGARLPQIAFALAILGTAVVAALWVAWIYGWL